LDASQDLNVIAEFEVRTDPQEGDVAVVAITGELDAATAPRLTDALENTIESSPTAVLVDLSECSFIDSTGLGVIVSARARLVEEGRRFEICCAGAQARRILEITGLDDAFGFFDTREAALTELAG
jgi:anti-sigma B factor antagonist